MRHRRSRREASSTAPSTALCSSARDAVTARHWRVTAPPKTLDYWWGVPVPVLSRLFRRLFLEGLNAAYQAGRLQFFADQAALAQPAAFQTFLAALRKVEWVVYAKRPFASSS